MVSIAFCDTYVALVYIPVFPLDETLKKLTGIQLALFFGGITAFLALFNLAALTFERYIAIFNGLRYAMILTDRRINLSWVPFG